MDTTVDDKFLTQSKFMNRILPLVCECWNLVESREYISCYFKRIHGDYIDYPLIHGLSSKSKIL